MTRHLETKYIYVTHEMLGYAPKGKQHGNALQNVTSYAEHDGQQQENPLYRLVANLDKKVAEFDNGQSWSLQIYTGNSADPSTDPRHWKTLISKMVVVSTQDASFVQFNLTGHHSGSLILSAEQTFSTVPQNVSVKGHSHNGLDFNMVQSSYRTMACFLEGTMILTLEGERPVETLQAGDVLRTASGGEARVMWLGKKTVSRARIRDKDLPVCIRKDALGTNVPHSDLYVTADHGMVIGEYIVNASALVNGRTVEAIEPDVFGEIFSVYHIETESHDEIYANGAVSETFIDFLGRSVFDNYDEYLAIMGSERIIREMKALRISSQRQLPDEIRTLLGIEDVLEAELEHMLSVLSAA